MFYSFPVISSPSFCYALCTMHFLEHILTGRQIDSAEYDILYKQKVIAHNLIATKEQVIDDLNGVMSDLQKKMMRILPDHLDECNSSAFG